MNHSTGGASSLCCGRCPLLRLPGRMGRKDKTTNGGFHHRGDSFDAVVSSATSLKHGNSNVLLRGGSGSCRSDATGCSDDQSSDLAAFGSGCGGGGDSSCSEEGRQHQQCLLRPPFCNGNVLMEEETTCIKVRLPKRTYLAFSKNVIDDQGQVYCNLLLLTILNC